MTDRCVLGFGCERGIASDTIARGIQRFLGDTNADVSDIACIGTIDLKKDEQGLLDYIAGMDLRIEFYEPGELRETSPPNPSQVVKDSIGVASVAEAAALMAGDSDQLLREKNVLKHGHRAMTLALARHSNLSRKDS